MTGYRNHVNKLSPTHPAYMYQPPHQGMDAVGGDLTKLVENMASVHTFCDRGGIMNPKGHGIITMKPVNDGVVNCSIVRLNQEIQTIFDEPKPVKDNGESGSAQDKERTPARGTDDDLLLSISDLEYIGLATSSSYLRQTGQENPLYTIMGKLIDLLIPNAVQRSIRQVFFWDETTTYRVNDLLMMVLNMAFDMSPFPDLVDTLHGMHALQTIDALMFNRIQVHKVTVPLVNYGSSLGYRPTLTGGDIVRLMKDVRIFSILMKIFAEQPMFPTSPLLLQQVLDGLLRMVHHLRGMICIRHSNFFGLASSSRRPFFP